MNRLAAIAWLLLAPLAHAEDWPRFLGPAGTGVSGEKGIVTPWPAKGPKVLWQLPLAAGYSMPTIAEGKLVLFERVEDRARCVCLRLADRKVLWKFDYPTDYRDRFGYSNGPRCSPLIDRGFVFLHGAEGMIHALKLDDGALAWNCDTAREFGLRQNFFGVASSPVVADDVVIVPIGGGGEADEDPVRPKSNGTGIVAFERTTGKVRYKIGDERASYGTPTLATINGQKWCFHLARGGLLAFDPATGGRLIHQPWRADIAESVNAANPVVIGDRVFISETYGPGGAMLKLAGDHFDTVWSDEKKAIRDKGLLAHWATPIHHDGYLYGSSGRHDSNAELRCIDAATGKIMWSQARLTRSTLIMVDGHFICLSEDGMLRLLRVNPKKCDIIAEVEITDAKTGDALLREPCWAPPIISNGRLYVRGADRLLCLKLMRE
jgi:outer membrane protein assembly factor BamB